MRVLLAVDIDGQGADTVVDMAGHWAGRMRARLDLLYVMSATGALELISDPRVRKVVEEEQQRHRERDEARMGELMERLGDTVHGEARCLVGSPEKVLLAEVRGYDLLILATHQRKGVAHLWLGSVAEKLVRTCPIPVLVLPIGADR